MKAEDVIMKIVAVLAPTPTAWMVGESTLSLMHFPLPVAIAAALTVEGLGFVAVNTVTEMIEFNRHINGVEAGQKMHAPIKQAIGVVILYVMTATIMTIILHIFPSLIVWAPLPFITMMVSVGWMYALRKDHEARIDKWGKGRDQVASKRKKAKTQGKSKKNSLPQVARKRFNDDELLAYLAEQPKASHQAIADHFGVKRQAIGPRLKKLESIRAEAFFKASIVKE